MHIMIYELTTKGMNEMNNNIYKTDVSKTEVCNDLSSKFILEKSFDEMSDVELEYLRRALCGVVIKSDDIAIRYMD